MTDWQEHRREAYRESLAPLVMEALLSDSLRDWSAGYLTAAGRRLDDRRKGQPIRVLEAYLVDHNDPEDGVFSLALVQAFGDVIQEICGDETLSLRITYNGVSWLLAGWHYLAAVARLKIDDPRMVLPVCAAVGTGVHAVAFLAVPEGVRSLMHQASGSLEPVRRAAALGLQRMLLDDWEHTMAELRRYAHIGDAYQHRAAVLAVAGPEALDSRARALDALDLLHTILGAYRRMPGERRCTEAARSLSGTLTDTIATLLLVERRAGFAAARTWLAWDDDDIRAIVRASVATQPLASFEEAIFLRQSYPN